MYALVGIVGVIIVWYGIVELSVAHTEEAAAAQ